MHRSAQAVTMRDQLDVIKRADGADLQQFRDAATPLRIGLHNGKRILLQVALHFPATVKVLAACYGHGGAAVHLCKAANLLWMRHLFHPAWAVLLDLVCPLERVVLVPSAEGVEHQFSI